MKNRKLKFSKKKPCGRKEFLNQDVSKFDMDFKDDNFTNFNKYDFDPDKSLDFEGVICRRNEFFLSSCNYDMG